MPVTASWLDENEKRPLRCDSLADLLREAAASSPGPVIVVLEAAGASLHLLAGHATGTVVRYYPPAYEHVGVGSRHSIGDAEAAAIDAWQPPLTAYAFGHHTEFPRWSVVPHDVGECAARQFCELPTEPPAAVSWEPD